MKLYFKFTQILYNDKIKLTNKGKKLMKFSGKNVLITGASKGIGAAIARVLADFGLKVWINYRSKPELADALKDAIISKGAKAAVIKFDASEEDEFEAGIKTILESDGELSYLVNNAGITNDKLALRMKLEDFTKVLDTNFWVVARL